MHFSRKYEVCKSKTEQLRDENLFWELKVRTTSFELFQIHKVFIVICQTFIVSKYRVYIIVSVCLLYVCVCARVCVRLRARAHAGSFAGARSHGCVPVYAFMIIIIL